jgi:hypothetical protein
MSELKPVNFYKINLAFVIDTTGSMGFLINEAKNRAHGIIKKMSSSLSLKCAVVEYRDHPPQDSSFVYRIQRVGRSVLLDPKSVATAISKLSAQGGGDEPEAVYDGIHAAATEIPWEKDALTRIAVLIGDAVPHGCLEHEIEVVGRQRYGGSWPKKTPSGIGLHECASAAETVGMRVYSIPLNTGCNLDFERISVMTGGRLLSPIDPMGAIEELLTATKETADKMTAMYELVAGPNPMSIEAASEKIGIKVSEAYKLYVRMQSALE